MQLLTSDLDADRLFFKMSSYHFFSNEVVLFISIEKLISTKLNWNEAQDLISGSFLLMTTQLFILLKLKFKLSIKSECQK